MQPKRPEQVALFAGAGQDTTRCAGCDRPVSPGRRWCELMDAEDRLLGVWCSWPCVDPSEVVRRLT